MTSVLFDVSLTTRGCLVKREFTGVVSVDQIIASLEGIVEASIMKLHSVKVLNDLSNCELELSKEEFVKLMTYLRTEQGLRKINFAVITDKPKNAVFAHVAEHTIPCLAIRLFSTTDAAEKWLMMN